MHQPRKWEEYLPLVEFSYNNGYQESLKMAPFEALYGRKYNIPIIWDNPVDRVTLGLKMLVELEQQMTHIEKKLKVAQDLHRSYVDNKRIHKEFKIGDHVYLRIKKRIISLRMGVCAKLAPRFCDPFKIMDRMGPVVYKLALPP